MPRTTPATICCSSPAGTAYRDTHVPPTLPFSPGSNIFVGRLNHPDIPFKDNPAASDIFALCVDNTSPGAGALCPFTNKPYPSGVQAKSYCCKTCCRGRGDCEEVRIESLEIVAGVGVGADVDTNTARLARTGDEEGVKRRVSMRIPRSAS